MSAWHHFYEFWVGQQTLPGNILGDVLIGAATFIIGKYKVAPWLHARHKERLEQSERQHREILKAHQDLKEMHERHHREILAQTGKAAPPQATPDPIASTDDPAT
jgi:hypothetical protein